MPRYSKFRRRYRRRIGPAYSVTRKLVKAGAFSRIAESQYYAASAKLCVNPSNLTSDRVGSIVTVKLILRYSWQTFQLILGSTKPKM